MEKEELLENIVSTENIIVQNNRLQMEWNRLNEESQIKIRKRWLVIAIIIIYTLSKIHPLAGWAGLFSMILAYFYYKKMVKRKIPFLLSKKSELDQKYDQNIETLNRSVIPPDYRNLYSLNKIEGFLKNQRADTLKECINLLENDNKHEEQIENLKRIQAQNNALYQLGIQREQSEGRKVTGIHMK